MSGATDNASAWIAKLPMWAPYEAQIEKIARLAAERGFGPDDVTLVQRAEKKLFFYFGDWSGPVGTKYTVIHATGGYTAEVLH